MKTRVFESFAGFGTQALALKRLKQNYPDFDFEVVGISEVDEHAIKAYNAVHGDTPNYGDISKIDWSQVPDFDLFTYSSPCQDYTQIGKMKGGEEGSGTRSSLLWECRRAIETKRPKYAILENVKNLTSKKFIGTLQKWMFVMNGLGYTNYTKVLDAIDFGVAQHRERVFMVSILNDEHGFFFPKEISERKSVSDVILKDFVAKEPLKQEFVEIIQEQFGNIKKPCIVRRPHGYITRKATLFSPPLTRSARGDYFIVTPNHEGNVSVRRMTSVEAMRFMDVDDESAERMINAGISETQMFKLAGNAIPVGMLYHIFRKMLVEREQETSQFLMF